MRKYAITIVVEDNEDDGITDVVGYAQAFINRSYLGLLSIDGMEIKNDVDGQAAILTCEIRYGGQHHYNETLDEARDQRALLEDCEQSFVLGVEQ